MKTILLYILLMWISLCAIAQDKVIDSLDAKLVMATSDSVRAFILWEIADAYAANKPDSELFKAQQSLTLSRKIKYVTGEMKALKSMAEANQALGNYPMALQYYLQRLKLDEKNPDPDREVVTMLSIANLYQSEGEYGQAIVYAKKGYLIINKNKLEDRLWYSYMIFGDTYEKMNDVPNAIFYNKAAYDLALKNKDPSWIGMCLNNTGNAYVKAQKYPEALDYYRRGIPYLKANNNESFLCESYQGISGILYKNGSLDSAAFYAKLSLNLAVSRSFSQKYLRSCQLLADIYKAHHLADSALVYQGKLLVMKDSIYSNEKERQIANLTISEELRQKERLQEKLEDEQERSYKLKLLLVGLLIPFSFLISLILSKRKLHARIIEFSGVLSLLLLFEYLTLLLHPLVMKLTNHSPFLEIIIFVSLAAVLTPSHHRLEHWMLFKLTAHKHHPHPIKDETPPEQPAAVHAVKENDDLGLPPT